MQDQTTETAPIIAHADDISKEFAERAYSGVSFSPEKRGESRRNDYADHVNGLYAELWPIATTEEQRAILATEMDRYREGYLSRCNALLGAKSRVVSTMIAGPSNFPVARMQKRADTEHRRLTELLEWSNSAKAAIRRKLLDARPTEVKASAEWMRIKRDILDSLTTIKGIDDGAEFYTRSAFVNSIAGKVERLARNGEIELVDKAIGFVRSFNELDEVKKPAISPKHKFWTFGELARECAAKNAEASRASSEVIASADGVEAITNPEIDRVQILFDDKPDASTISALRSGGWNWSPSNGAWQRKLTPNAVHAAKQFVGKLQTA